MVRETKVLIYEDSHSSEGEDVQTRIRGGKCKALDVGRFCREISYVRDGFQIEVSQASH